MKEEQIVFGNKLNGIITGDGKRGGVVLAHGAGQGMDAPLLSKTAAGLAELGFVVLRFNFGYLGKKSAPSKDGKNEKPEFISAIEYIKERVEGNPILIGKSFGARIGSYIAAERNDIRILVYYGLPLQGINGKQRDWSHLAKIGAPMLFITGNKDKLCPLTLLAEVQKPIETHFSSEVVPGDHSFKPKSEDAAVELCLAWIATLE